MTTQTAYGIGGFDASKPNNNIISDTPDPEYDATTARVTNMSTIRQQATSALTANRTYLALAAPVAADNVLQIRALTRQNNALIRMMLGLLDGTN